MSDNVKLLAAPRSVQEFYALLYSIELEAAERYIELADQMEVHNNPAVATLFRELAEIEGRHADRMRTEGQGVQAIRPRDLMSSVGFEWPETMPFDTAHYLMTPAHALRAALANEQQTARCFEELAITAGDPAIRSLAAEVAREERHHVELLQRWVAQYPEPDPGWNEDPDPPRYSE
jgi:rubrerythrin